MATQQQQQQPQKRGLMEIAPEPASKLGYYRLLAPNCGLRVSPICLGVCIFYLNAMFITL